MGIRVVTDSACDLPAHLVQALGIEVVPLTIRFGSEEFVDQEELTTAEFWDRLERFEKGLKLLEPFHCPIIVGDLPDASAAVERMLTPDEIPSPTALSAANLTSLANADTNTFTNGTNWSISPTGPTTVNLKGVAIIEDLNGLIRCRGSRNQRGAGFGSARTDRCSRGLRNGPAFPVAHRSGNVACRQI